MSAFDITIFAAGLMRGLLQGILFLMPGVAACLMLHRQLKQQHAKDIAKILNASRFAAFHHREVPRKNALHAPYIVHPLRVAEFLLKYGYSADVDVDLLVAAICHDGLEDTKMTPEEIRKRFGDRVLQLVLDVTDDKSLPQTIRKLKQIEHAETLCEDAADLKAADKLENCWSLLSYEKGGGIPEGWSVQRVQEYVVWAKKVVNALPKVKAPLRDAFDKLVNQETFEYFDGKSYPVTAECS